MPPSAIINTDLDTFDKTIYYAAELDKIWKATSLGGGAAVWNPTYDSAGFAGGTFLGFSRVRYAEGQQNLIYALGFAQKPGQTGNECTAYCFVSSSGGTTWNYYEISDDLEFLFNGGLTYLSKACTGGTESNCVATFWESGGSAVCEAAFDGGAEFQWTECFGNYELPEELEAGHIYSLEYDAIGVMPSLGYDADGDCPPYIHYLVSYPIVEGSFSVISGGYHFAGTIDTDRMPDRSQLKIGWFYGRPGRWLAYTAAIRQCTIYNLTINGIEYSGQPPAGFDVSRTNPNWLYVGFQDKIMASEDGAVNWFDLYTGHGANDICVDPQLAGAIYYWATDGNLNLLVKQELGKEVLTLTSTGLMIETPNAIPIRIARDPSSGRLLAIQNGCSLLMRNLGIMTYLKLGLVNGRGLHVYPGQKMIMVDANDIWISDDIQAETPTITAKKGGWAGYANGVQAHRMVAP